MKFRKKPVVIEATQWFKDGDHPLVRQLSVRAWFMFDNHTFREIDTSLPLPKIVDQVRDCFRRDRVGAAFVRTDKDDNVPELRLSGSWKDDYAMPESRLIEWAGKVVRYPCRYVITTLEGDHEVSVGDWIITGIAGETYACKPDIFAATYEPVEELEKRDE